MRTQKVKLRKAASFARRWAQVTKQRDIAPEQRIIVTGNCVQDPKTHTYVVAPAVDGRIAIIGAGGAAAAAGQQPAVVSPLKPGQGTSAQH